MSTEAQTKQSLMTPFNVIAGLILVLGVVLTIWRFAGGIGAVTNLDNNNPWGIWIGFDLLCGVALAAGGYVTSSAVYLFGMKKHHAAVRPAILTAFLGYLFVVVALQYDLGRPWRLPYPFVVSAGTTSMLFEVGLCVALYLTVLFLEFSPAALEYFGQKRLRNLIHKCTIALTVFGVVLSTLHQSSLGALYIVAPSKLHPLWYSAYLPTFFFVSSAAAGMSMVMLEGWISHGSKTLHSKMSEEYLGQHDDLYFGFAKGASWVLMGYFFIKVIGIAADNEWHLLATGWGQWFLFELLGFALLPSFLYAIGAREKNLKLIKWTALLTVLGIVLNRLNVSLIAYNYHLPSEMRYFPSWQEIGVTLFVCTMLVVTFKFISSKTPIFYDHPDYKDEH
ncbi:Protein DVU_0534 [Pseudodesulfovibrio profundus]|uniref:Protein DVU_0534 n=1 Tax=Pseudodesulfovibrio profundus TaxID=57320 RepID=A0A2C8FDN9_9BACT|nr:NrfD/PsrC family molybdoenzyme membrane anchor subunit [Pseudodesulfovibrio profundus]SOB60575.1 Protein DVU_0534 [Pseudodesulfovibrio profundus]